MRLFIVLATVLCAVNCDNINAEIKNRKVERSINLESQLVKVSDHITIENAGRSEVRSFLFALDAKVKNNLAHIAASSGGETLKLVPTKVAGKDGILFWKVELSAPLQSGATIQVNIESILTHVLKAFPAEITQSEKQLMMYSGFLYFYSPYTTVMQTTKVTLSSNNIENYTKVKPVSHTDTTISYGPYNNIQPFASDALVVHFENNNPFLTVSSMTRWIEVSHWGNIAVEETLDIYHHGAKLKGSFSRYEFQREQNSGISSIKNFKTVLPASAMDVYYRDEIGNISTSNMRVMHDAVELDLRPRFPLFGGWKTHYILGYNLPSYEYLFYKGDEYALKMRYLDHIFDDMQVDELRVQIVLPEGASDIDMNVPYNVERLSDVKHYTYLDVTGRTVVSTYKTNLVESHIQDFVLKYHFPRFVMFQEPFLVVAALYLFFIVVIIYMRLDFSITKDEASESRLRVGGLCERVQFHHDRRTTIYRSYDDVLTKFKSAKDGTAFANSIKNLNLEHKTETAAVTELIGRIKTEAPEIADRVDQLQRMDKSVKELLAQQTTFAEKLVSGRMSKSQYVDNDNNVNRKKEETISKMDELILTL